MAEAIRKGDQDQLGNTVTGSATKVYIAGQLAARKGDAMTNGYVIDTGSSKVMIEGAPAARAGDATTASGQPSSTLVAAQSKVLIT